MYCGQHNDDKRVKPHHLKPEMILNKKYYLGKAIFEDDCFITYSAYSIKDRKPVKIKEFFVKGKSCREDGRVEVKQLLDNATRIINIGMGLACSILMGNPECDEKLVDYFCMNNTFYTVLVAVEGIPIDLYFNSIWRTSNYKLNMLKPVFEQIAVFHSKGIVHAGIDMSTIVIDSSAKIHLLNCNITPYIRNMLCMEGAILEKKQEFSFHSDVYDFAILIYKLLSGKIVSKDQIGYNLDELVCDISSRKSDVIMQNIIDSRENSIEDFMKALFHEWSFPSRKKKISYISEIGSREENEDSFRYFIKDDKVIIVVADGAGEHNKGKMASKTAVDTICEYLQENDISESSIADSFELANKLISEKDSDAKTTVVAFIKDGKRCYSAHMGDSRLYQIRKNKIIYKTRDHSIVQMLIDEELITEEERKHHPRKNEITRALGVTGYFIVDVIPIEYKKGDKFLLATDGFWDHLDDANIGNVSDGMPWLESMKAHINRVNKGKEQDNFTAVLYGD